jgi:hypothetical protein
MYRIATPGSSIPSLGGAAGRAAGAGEPLYTEPNREIRYPSLTGAGDIDCFIPASLSQIIADAIRGVGRIPYNEKPHEAAEPVLEFREA